MAARALHERMMINTAGDHGSLEKNLRGYEISVGPGMHTRDAIRAVLGVGHAVIRRAIKIGDPLLLDVMDHLDYIVHAVCVLPERTKAIEWATPSRPERVKKDASQQGGGSR
jgi:hypothetical protein